MGDAPRTLSEKKTLTVSVGGHIAEVCLTRPERLNVIDLDTHNDLLTSFQELEQLREHQGIRAAVFSSTGRVFSAGGGSDSINAIHDDRKVLQHGLDEARRVIMSMIDVQIPIIAAVQGPAMGLAANLVFNCDAVVASRKGAAFADSHVKFGLAAGDGGGLMWPQSAGMLLARRYLLTGDRLDAERAHAMGLVTDLVDDPEEVVPAAHELAGRIAALPPLAVQGTKRALASIQRARANEILELGLMIEAQTLISDDLVEAITAFREKRPGVYRGR